MMETTKDEDKLDVKVKLNKVLGRNAMFKRNNLFYDFNDSIITHSGCNILVMSKETSQPLQQRVAQLDSNRTEGLPEISAMTISGDRKILAIGTFSEEAHIFVWDINSETTLFRLNLKEIVEVTLLRFSHSNNYIVATGITSQKHPDSLPDRYPQRADNRLSRLQLHLQHQDPRLAIPPHLDPVRDMRFAQRHRLEILLRTVQLRRLRAGLSELHSQETNPSQLLQHHLCEGDVDQWGS